MFKCIGKTYFPQKLLKIILHPEVQVDACLQLPLEPESGILGHHYPLYLPQVSKLAVFFTVFFFFSFDYFHIQCIIFTTIATTKYYLLHDLYFHIYLHFIPYDLWHDGVAYCLHEFKSQKAKMFWELIPTLVELQVKNRQMSFFARSPSPLPLRDSEYGQIESMFKN